MMLSIVGRQGHFGEVIIDCRNSVYLGGEDRHEHEVWYSSAESMVTAALGCLHFLQQTNLSSFKIIKDKKWIGMDCASITRAGEKTGVGGDRRHCRVVRTARLRCRKSP